MKDPAGARIYSERAGDPELEEALDQFVLGLAERIDRLQDAQATGDHAGLAKLTADLVRDATSLGYPQLASAGTTALEAARRRDAACVLDGVRELTDLGYRVRLGHRGAF
ncbi:MAG TPA: hypothetical protein VFG80_05645 [Myxococcota bacterium]|nr:hypothetical protein [Myxococcota bacterium]